MQYRNVHRLLSPEVLETTLRRQFEFYKNPEIMEQSQLKHETWVRAYLEEHSENFDIEIFGDLDQEAAGQRRGDYRVKWRGRECILEVEKDVRHYFKHNHTTEGDQGWDDVASIDLVFAISDSTNRQNDIDAPVIIEEDIESGGRLAFSKWYDLAKTWDYVKNDLPVQLMYTLSKYLASVLFEEIERVKEWIQHEDIHLSEAPQQNKEMWETAKLGLEEVFIDMIEGFRDRHCEGGFNELLDSVDSTEQLCEIFEEGFIGPVGDGEPSGECPECDGELYILMTHSKTLNMDSLNRENMTDGQMSMQIAGRENPNLVGGVTKRAVRFLSCDECSRFFLQGKRVTG